MQMNRRKFITGAAAAGALTLLPAPRSEAAVTPDSYATLIDLAKCDGCEGKEVPLCVSSCRTQRQDAFPDPPKEQLRDYWPQKKHEDWSGKRHLKDRFTPYNWIFVQRVEVDGKAISIPRRCMHCDNPPCAKLCPFGIKHKTKEGPVYIDQSLCFGGAKCRSVCPWSVPQRQAGVGIYTLWQKYLPVGGGVMFKCDLCRDELMKGNTPHCIAACPKKAMEVGKRGVIFAKAENLKNEYRGDIYGMDENGGTSTLYVSPVPFDKIDKALVQQNKDLKKKMVTRLHRPENMLAKQKNWALLSLASPLVGGILAYGLSGTKESGGRE
ncbi:MAG: 4Fe-4S dicluster domain-containing protein [Desulforhopalus sp.]